jgi:hypothetical protein
MKLVLKSLFFQPFKNVLYEYLKSKRILIFKYNGLHLRIIKTGKMLP